VLTRSLFAAVVVAAAVLVPSAASAAPADRGVAHQSTGEGFRAQAVVELPDGRPASVTVAVYRRGPEENWQGELELEVACESSYSCREGGSGLVDLTGAQLDLSRSLSLASATDVPITLFSWDDRYAQNQVERQVTVSVWFTGTGTATHDSSLGEQCWAFAGECRSVSVDASRSATARLTLGDVEANGTGSVSYGRTVVVAGGN
jgi:hypothetical protein